MTAIVSDSKAGRLEALVDAGFAVVSRAVLTVCRMRVSDFARGRKWILPHRAISLLSFACNQKGPTIIELTVNTVLGQTERGAVQVMVRYFSFFGREIVDTSGGGRFSLFADPLGTNDSQRLYSNTPANAFWVLVTIQRQTRERRIGIFGSLRPRPLKDAAPLGLDDALNSRGRRSLEYHLACARDARDRKTAMQLLSRMIFLERRPSDIQNLRFVADIEQVMADLAGKASVSARAAPQSYCYDSLLTVSFDNNLPFSKWLASEAISLRTAAGALGEAVTVLAIPPGPHRGLRALTAAYAGYSISVDSEQSNSSVAPEQIPWIRHEELLSF